MLCPKNHQVGTTWPRDLPAAGQTGSKSGGNHGSENFIPVRYAAADDRLDPSKEFGREVAEMFLYTSEPGYDGGMRLITVADMRKVSKKPVHQIRVLIGSQEGIDCPMTSLEDFVRKTDWADTLSK